MHTQNLDPHIKRWTVNIECFLTDLVSQLWAVTRLPFSIVSVDL